MRILLCLAPSHTRKLGECALSPLLLDGGTPRAFQRDMTFEDFWEVRRRGYQNTATESANSQRYGLKEPNINPKPPFQYHHFAGV